MIELFQKNLKILQEQNPLLTFPLHLIRPKKENLKKAAITPLEKTQVLYLYGVGPCYKDLKGWLHEESNRKLIFIEDELERFSFFLNEPETERLLLDPQVEVVIVSGLFEYDLKDVIWRHLFFPYECFSLYGKNPQFPEHFFDLTMHAEHTLSLYREYGIPIVRNNLKNFKRLAIRGDALKGKLKGVPAIICGAGPSLRKNSEELKKLEKYAVNFVGGSAILPLQRRGVKIHFGGAVDPDPPLTRYGDLTFPFFFQNQTSHELLSKVEGPLIRLGSSGAFPTDALFERDIPSFDPGTNVGSFLTHVATLLGCSPIILVGMDGCLFEKAVYVDGIQEKKRSDPIPTVDQFQNPTHSRVDFLLGRRWLEHFAQSHPDTLFLNATEGGISMRGILDTSLEEVQKKWLTQKIEIPSFLEEVNLKKEETGHDAILDAFETSMKISIDVSKHSPINIEQQIFEEIFYQLILLPNWNAWRYLLQRDRIIRDMEDPDIEKQVQEIVFFQQVCREYEWDL